MSVATIGSALAEKRRELGLEKGQAADKIGMSRTTYSSYEQDAQRPSVDVFPALAEFLAISMEELLSLYGATCVAAVRPSLERLLADQSRDTPESPTEASSPRFDDIATSVSVPSIESTESHPDAEEETHEVVLELRETSFESEPQTEPDTSEKQVVISSNTEELTNEVVLEIQELPTEPAAHDFRPLPLPDLEGLAESHQSPDPFKPQDQVTAPIDSAFPSAEPSAESVVFEPSPYFIRTSLSDSSAKGSDSKKKKKKKKKKK